MSERAAKVTPPDDEQDDDQITDSAAPDAATEDDAAAGDAETTPAPVTSGAEAVVRALENAGVEYAFGVQGGAIMPVYDALYDSDIRHVTMAHEQGRSPRGRRIRHRLGRAGRLPRNLGAGRDKPRYRHRGRRHGLGSAARADGAGPDRVRRQRRVSGDRYHGRHDADHEGQHLRERLGSRRQRRQRGVRARRRGPTRTDPGRPPQRRHERRDRLRARRPRSS